MSDANHSMSTIKIKIFLSFIVPHMTTFALHNIDIEKRIYGKKIHSFVNI